MSDREGRGGSGFGAFVLGVAVGAVVGFLFAPEAGEDTRRKLSKRLRNLRDVAGEKVDEVRGMLESDGDDDEEGGEADGEDEEVSTREQLRRRLDAARRRRRRGADAPAQVEEEDEPLA